MIWLSCKYPEKFWSAIHYLSMHGTNAEYANGAFWTDFHPSNSNDDYSTMTVIDSLLQVPSSLAMETPLIKSSVTEVCGGWVWGCKVKSVSALLGNSKASTEMVSPLRFDTT